MSEITGGQGVDLVFEHVGGELFKEGIDSLRRDGRLVTCGAHAGEVVDFDIIPFFRAQHTVIGSFVYTREELEKVLEFARRGLIPPLVHSCSRSTRCARRRGARERARLREDPAPSLAADEHTRRLVGDDTMKRLGVDVGGTFTDLIYVDDETGTILVHKLPTTSDDPSRGHDRGHQGADRAGGGDARATLDQVFHGTTIATNIVIEHNGAQGGDDHHRGLPRHPPHRPAQEAAATSPTTRTCPGRPTRSSGAGTG